MNTKVPGTIRFFCLLATLIMGFASMAQANPPSPEAGEANSQKKEVLAGLYITNLYDINFSKNEYKTEFWAWFLNDDPTYQPKTRTEIVNSKNFSIRNATKEKIDDVYWHSMNVKGTIKQDWDVRMFPFDKQVLTINIEDTLETTDDMVFYPDIQGSKIDPNTIPDGWVLEDFQVSVSSTPYNTTFGDPRAEADSAYDFHRIQAKITLKREGFRIFTTTFLGFFVATVLVIIVFLINSSSKGLPVIPLQPRITLCVGALFAAVGSIYGLDAKLPYTTEFTLADSLQVTTFFGIAMAIINSVLSDILLKNGRPKLVSIANWVVLAIFVCGHLGLNAYTIGSSMMS